MTVSVRFARLKPTIVDRVPELVSNERIGAVPISFMTLFLNVVAILCYPSVNTYSIAKFSAALNVIAPELPATETQLFPSHTSTYP